MTRGDESHDPRPHEEDVRPDDAQALSRATGGVADAEAPDQASTTGTTPKGEYVGRIAGDDVGYAGEQGADRRAALAEQEKQQGG